MLGSVFDVLYALPTRPTPSAAVSTIVRSSPVIRETSVATAIVPAARRIPRAAPGAPSRRSASSSVSATGPRGTGGRDVITCVWPSSAAGTQRFRPAARGGRGGTGPGPWRPARGGGARGGGGRAAARGAGGVGGAGAAAAARPFAAPWSRPANGADGGGAAWYGGGGRAGPSARGARVDGGRAGGGTGGRPARPSPSAGPSWAGATGRSSSGPALTPGSGWRAAAGPRPRGRWPADRRRPISGGGGARS